jgi:uncharacterized protein YbjT (DUF2867 family)
MLRRKIMILLTGATGNVGAAVLEHLRKTNVPFRAMYRTQADATKAPSNTATVVADFADSASLRAALRGIDQLFLVCSPIPDLVKLEANVIDIATETGVKHLVLNSALGAGDYPSSFPAWHRIVEEKLKASPLQYTILRPNSFMQNIVAYLAPGIRSQGAFYAAMGEARTSYLDLSDIGAAITNILLAPGTHIDRTYELNGPDAVTYTELADRISRVAGRNITYVDIPEQAQRESMLKLGMPAWQVDALLDLQRYYTGGQGGEITDTLRSLLNRPPITLDTFLEANKQSFCSEA